MGRHVRKGEQEREKRYGHGAKSALARHTVKTNRHYTLFHYKYYRDKSSRSKTHLRPTPVKSKCDWQFLKGDALPTQSHGLQWLSGREIREVCQSLLLVSTVWLS
ncbi:hypothetical protein IRJ41_001504 [Triplophysa rosa]|uniref:Uncharacterized protein n=1 Tax=Triplophysa rosa TaxID=992332 RepID=A0A9W7TL97_TRIRA|nr:hypothetical protein IRJ41_001504 [Triplophysa rosa]